MNDKEEKEMQAYLEQFKKDSQLIFEEILENTKDIPKMNQKLVVIIKYMKRRGEYITMLKEVVRPQK